MNSGRRNQVMPGQRILWIVTMKFRPVRIELKPAMKMPDDRQHDIAVGIDAGVRRVERPAGIDAADDQRGQGESRRRS